MTRRYAPIRWLSVLPLVVVAAACSDDSPAPELSQPSTLIAVSGDGQTVANGPVPAADSLVVRVLDPTGQGVAGVTVNWAASDGTGSVSPASVSTDAQGRAATRWTLGSSAGTQTARATTPAISGASVVFTGVNRMPSGLEIAAGDGQSLINGPDALEDSLVVRVVDAQGRAIVGAEVTWSAGEGAGSVAPATSTSDAQGLARTSWILGDAEGMQTATAALASAEGVSTTFLAEHVLLTIDVAVTTDPMPPVGLAPEVPARASGRTSPALANAAPHFPPIPTRRLIVRHEPGALGLSASGADGPVLAPGAIASVEQAIRLATAPWKTAGKITKAEISPVLKMSRIEVAPGVDVEAFATELRAQPGIASVKVEQLEYMRPHVERAPKNWPGKIGSLEDLRLGRGVNGVAPARAFAAAATTSPIMERFPDVTFWMAQAWHYEAVDAPLAWSSTTGDRSVVVAVIDDGIRFDHPDIADNLSDDGYNFVAAGPKLDAEYPVCWGGVTTAEEAGYGPDPTQPMDWTYNSFENCFEPSFSGNHGLHVAGTIGATGEGEVAIGLNWQITIRPVRVLNTLGYGSYFDVAQGVLYAAGLPASDGAGGTVTAPSAAPIINMSLGGGYDDTQADAIAAAVEAGSLIIASAGNSSSGGSDYPAAFDGVISVVALGPDLGLASYTNVGWQADIAAPGGDYRLGYGGGVLSTTWNFYDSQPSWDLWQGTSMAAPHVAGVAALVLAANPGLSREQLEERLLTTATNLGHSGWDQRWGHGLVNAYNAVTGRPQGPERTTHVRLYDPETGAMVAQQAAGGSGQVSLRGVAEGEYWVFAGQDLTGDSVLHRSRRRLGWAGGPNRLSPVSVAATGPRRVTTAINVSTPYDAGDNLSLDEAQILPVESRLVGQVSPDTPSTFYEVRIPEEGVWRFETEGVLGVCGWGIEVDTVLTLFSDSGEALATNDDVEIDVDPVSGTGPFCSRIDQELTVGTYYLQVKGYEEYLSGRFSVSVSKLP